MNVNKNKKHLYTNNLLKYLPYFSGSLYFILCLLWYAYNVSYCKYFNIPFELVSFSLTNSIYVLIIYFLALSLFLLICNVVVSVISEIYITDNVIINKIISFLCSLALIFLIEIIFFIFYCKIMVDLELIDFLIFLFKDRKGNIFLLLNFVSSLFITVFCYYSEINSHFNSKVAKHNSNKVKRTIVIRFNSLIKNIKMPKSKIRKSVFVDRLVLMIIFIFFILALLSYAALIGYDNAKSNKEFWLVTNNIDKNETFIRLYSDNDKMILSPYTIASNSIIIYNSSIIIKPNNDYIVSRIKCKTVELESKHSNKIY